MDVVYMYPWVRAGSNIKKLGLAVVGEDRSELGRYAVGFLPLEGEYLSVHISLL